MCAISQLVSAPLNRLPIEEHFRKTLPQKTTDPQKCKGDVTRDHPQQRFLAQQSVAMLEQCWNHSK